MIKKDLQLSFEIFNPEDSFIEVRLLKTNRGTISGYFDNADDLFLKQLGGMMASIIYFSH